MKISKIRTFDSLHIAAAESANADVLLTTDDKMSNMASKLAVSYTHLDVYKRQSLKRKNDGRTRQDIRRYRHACIH